jgi:hypothetical protein
MAAQITFEDLKKIVLARLDEWIRNLGTEAQLPRQIIRGRPFSPLDMRREVQMGTEIGTEIISMEARKMGYVVE